MNWAQLRYRIRIGGIPWVAKTAMGLIRETSIRAATRKDENLLFSLGSADIDAPSILYIHSGWAIETVGRLWFGTQKIAKVTFVKAGSSELTEEFMDRFDLVWYGYSSLFRSHPCDPRRAVLAVHDPAELFPERAEWKSACTIGTERIRHLRSMRAVVVISREMQEVLAAAGVEARKIPTRSQIPLRDSSDIRIQTAALLAVGRIYRRKNFEQFKRIARQARVMGCSACLKGDHFPLSAEDYIGLLDRHPIYLCTSFQEGGPLPMMDAMHRGAVVITTPVGQATEIIDHAVNGFICRTDTEFLDIVADLVRDPKRLLALRIASMARIREARPPEVVECAASQVLADILAQRPGS